MMLYPAYVKSHSALLNSLSAYAPQPAPELEPEPEPESPTAATPQLGREPYITPPERYATKPVHYRTFLEQCSLQFELQPSSFPSEHSRVAYDISLSTGRACLWATAEWQHRATLCSTFK